MKNLLKWFLNPSHLALIFLGLIFSLPFSLANRTGLQPSFYLESLSFLLLWLMVLMAAWHHHLVWHKNATVLCLIGMYFPVQMLFQPAVYPVFSWLMLIIMVSLAFAVLAISALIDHYGKEKILWVISVSLLIATLFQCFVSWIQYFNMTHYFHGFLMQPKDHFYVFGQLAQRNHLGHFMMWGLLAGIYLYIEKTSPKVILSCIALIVFTFGLMSSRTAILYVMVLMIVSLLYRYFRPQQKAMANTIIIIMLSIIVIQWLMPLWLNQFQSGLHRLSHGEDASRLHEWHKAWLVFLENPWFGTGWQGYASAGFEMERNFRFQDAPHLNILFTHCHNSILQLLAETGLIGTGLIIGGLIYITAPLFRLPANHGDFFIIGVLLVSLIHSNLEYPLWYLYFLIPFVLLANLSNHFQAACKTVHSQKIMTIMATVMIAMTLNGFYQYHQLNRLYRSPNLTASQKAEALHQWGEQHILLSYYADYSAISQLPVFFDEAIHQKHSWLYDTLKRNVDFRPFSNIAARWSIAQWYAGEVDAANDWMYHTWQYYPARFRQDDKTIQEKKWQGFETAMQNIHPILKDKPHSNPNQ